MTVTLDSPQTVGTLQFGNSGGDLTMGYTVSGTNALTFDNSGSTALIAVSEGTHAITAPIALNSNLDVSLSGGSTLTISGSISESTPSSLTLDGNSSTGTLILSGSNTYSGGTRSTPAR